LKYDIFIIRLFDSPDYFTCLYYIADSTDPLTYTVVTLNIFFCVHFTWRWSPIGADICCSSAQ
jgi:hypothetical protein